MNKSHQVVEVVKFKKQPVNPSSYQPYQQNEEDILQMKLPINKEIHAQLTTRLSNCFASGSEANYSQVVKKLSIIISKISTPSEASIVTEKSQKANIIRKQSSFLSVSFLGEVQKIQRSTLFIIIRDCPIKRNNSHLQLRNSKGQILFYIEGFKIQEYDNRVTDKLKNILGEGNLIIINNQSTRKCSIDCAYFEPFQEPNQFIYIQNSLKIWLSHQLLQNNKHIFVLNPQQFPNSSLYFIRTDKYGTLISSKQCLRFYFSDYIDQLIEKYVQIKNLFSSELDNLEIFLEFTEYVPEIKYSILNILVHNKYLSIALTIKDAVQILVDFFLQSKITKIAPKRFNITHFPYRMKKIQNCLVCQKNSFQKTSVGDKNHKKNMKAEEHKLERSSLLFETTNRTKYSCQGCQKIYGKQIPICAICFKQFHENISFYLENQDEKSKSKSTEESSLDSISEQAEILSSSKKIEEKFIETRNSTDNKKDHDILRQLKSFQKDLSQRLKLFNSCLKVEEPITTQNKADYPE